jgi:enoyl-CoA hydratase/carnithine racemase
MLKLARDGGVMALTLDRPARGNALGPELVEALLAALAPSATDGLHAVVLRASGPHFCTGLDLSDLETATDGDLLHRLVRIETLLATLWHAPYATVAIARGRCWGAGADLFTVCERRIAAADARFRFPGAQFGIVLGTRRLAERIGADAARDIVLNGVEWDAQRALAAGLATGIDEDPSPAAPRVSPRTAEAIRAATRPDLRDADLAALVRSAAEPGLRQRIAGYRAGLRAAPTPQA